MMPTRQPRADWLWRSLVCGYLASTIVLSTLMLTYIGLICTAAGSAGWTHALAYNTLANAAEASPYLAVLIHFVAGMGFALLYGYWVEPQRTHNLALQGVRFAMVPCLLSLIVFFPLVGAGPFGLYLGAGPLPTLGNIILHAVYGASLAWLYGPLTDHVLFMRRDHDPEVVRATVSGSYRGGSYGLGIGSFAGLALGSIIYAVAGGEGLSTIHLPTSLLPLAVLLIGSALGCLVGFVFGMPAASPPPARTI